MSLIWDTGKLHVDVDTGKLMYHSEPAPDSRWGKLVYGKERVPFTYSTSPPPANVTIEYDEWPPGGGTIHHSHTVPLYLDLPAYITYLNSGGEPYYISLDHVNPSVPAQDYYWEVLLVRLDPPQVDYYFTARRFREEASGRYGIVDIDFPDGTLFNNIIVSGI